jgi:transcriptional regulator with XRE-family HTH domain
MVTPNGRPTVVRRQLGRRLRRLREEARKKIDDVTTSGAASRTKMWRIERGLVTVKVGDVLALARLYDADNTTIDELVRLAEATKDSGYTELAEGAVRETISIYADLEATAAVMSDYNCQLVPGLLQAEAYIRAIMYGTPGLPTDRAEQRIAFRLHRQRSFFDRPRPGRMDAVITAGALNLQVGSDSVMRAQRDHLRTLASNDDVSIRVLPAADGLHPTMAGPFSVLDFDDPDDPSVVCVENVIEMRYFDQAEHVARFRTEFEQARSHAVPVEDYLR